METIKCPTCGKKITRDDLHYSQKGTTFYNLVFDKNGEVEYQQEEFEATDEGEFYHGDCGGEALTVEQLKKLGVKI